MTWCLITELYPETRAVNNIKNRARNKNNDPKVYRVRIRKISAEVVLP